MCYSNKIESLSLRKCQYDQYDLLTKSNLSAITVTIISRSFTYRMATKINWHRYRTIIRPTSRHPMYKFSQRLTAVPGTRGGRCVRAGTRVSTGGTSRRSRRSSGPCWRPARPDLPPTGPPCCSHCPSLFNTTWVLSLLSRLFVSADSKPDAADFLYNTEIHRKKVKCASDSAFAGSIARVYKLYLLTYSLAYLPHKKCKRGANLPSLIREPVGG